MKKLNAGLMGLGLVAALTWFSGCATMDKAYEQQVTWTNTPVVKASTTTVVMTNIVPQVVERTKVVMVTNEATGAVSGYTAREPVIVPGEVLRAREEPDLQAVQHRLLCE